MHLWLIPMVYVGASAVSGLVVPRLEHAYLASYTLNLSVASAQAYLSAVASGMMALTGVVFAIAFVMGRVHARYPKYPMFNSRLGRRSVADMVGEAFGVAEAQARRIFKADGGIAQRLGVFFANQTNSTMTNEPVSFVR